MTTYQQEEFISRQDLCLHVNTNTSTRPNSLLDINKKEEDDDEDIELLEKFKSKSRRSSMNKAERRAEHNAIERARRECLNSKFQQLAEALPNLQNHRRPSKGQIVEKALDWVKQNSTKEDRYQYQIMQLQNENKRLLCQISTIRDNQQQQITGVATPPHQTSTQVNNCMPSHPLDMLQHRQQMSPLLYVYEDDSVSYSLFEDMSRLQLQYSDMAQSQALQAVSHPFLK